MYNTRVPLFMPYENVDELRQRLEGTVVLHHGKPATIAQCKGGRGLFVLLTDRLGNLLENGAWVAYKPNNGFDLAPPKARYWKVGNQIVWIFFPPSKGVYRQGRTSGNSMYKYPMSQRGPAGMSRDMIMRFMEEPTETRSVFSQMEEYGKGRDVVLSPNFALIRIDGAPRLHYRNRHDLGKISKLDTENNIMYVSSEGFVPTKLCLDQLRELGIEYV